MHQMQHCPCGAGQTPHEEGYSEDSGSKEKKDHETRKKAEEMEKQNKKIKSNEEGMMQREGPSKRGQRASPSHSPSLRGYIWLRTPVTLRVGVCMAPCPAPPMKPSRDPPWKRGKDGQRERESLSDVRTMYYTMTAWPVLSLRSDSSHRRQGRGSSA